MDLCDCGCGKEVSKPGNRYIRGHYRRKKKDENEILDQFKEDHEKILEDLNCWDSTSEPIIDEVIEVEKILKNKKVSKKVKGYRLIW